MTYDEFESRLQLTGFIRHRSFQPTVQHSYTREETPLIVVKCSGPTPTGQADIVIVVDGEKDPPDKMHFNSYKAAWEHVTMLIAGYASVTEETK